MRVQFAPGIPIRGNCGTGPFVTAKVLHSLHHNDENLLEITKCPRIAGMYMAEFLRLYEHYRARIKSKDIKTFKLTPDYGWSRKYFKAGSPETKARMAMAGTAT